MSVSLIHPTAVVAPGAKIAEDATVGPHSVIDGEVELGPEVEIGPHVWVTGRTRIGARTRIYPHSVIGAAPQILNPDRFGGTLEIGEDNERLILSLTRELGERRTAYDRQDQALAERYRERVARVREAEAAVSDGDSLSRAVAKSYFKLLSYKDEYEVARLHTQREFLDAIREDFGADAKLQFLLAPPLLNSAMDARGRPRKKTFGRWMLPVFRLLAAMRRVRGTAFDVFGYTAERRTERRLISDYEKDVREVCSSLATLTLEEATARLDWPASIRGFGHVKQKSVDQANVRRQSLLRKFAGKELEVEIYKP